MRYLFVDLLWNTPKQPEAEKEIYGFSCQLGWPWEQDGKTFGRYLRVEHPENITKQTKRRMNNNLTTLRQGWTLARAVDVFARTFSEFDVLVLWDEETLEMLQCALTRFGKKLPASRKVFVRALLKVIVSELQELSFQDGMELLHVSGKPDGMFLPKYRAGYLSQMLEALAWHLREIPEEKRRPLVQTRGSSVLHAPDCPAVRGRSLRLADWEGFCDGRKVCKLCQKRGTYSFYTRNELLQRNYPGREGPEPPKQPLIKWYYRIDEPEKRFHAAGCPCCQERKTEEGREVWKPLQSVEEAKALGLQRCGQCSGIGKRFENDREQILDYCAKHGLTCELEDDQLKVASGCGNWKLLVHGNDRKLWLYHKNTYNKDDPLHPTIVPGYHSQAYRAKTILEYLEYIVQHDAYRKNNPVKVYPKHSKKTKAQKMTENPQQAPRTLPMKNEKRKKKSDRPGKDARRERTKTKPEKKGVVHASSLEELWKLSKCAGSD